MFFWANIVLVSSAEVVMKRDFGEPVLTHPAAATTEKKRSEQLNERIVKKFIHRNSRAP